MTRSHDHRPEARRRFVPALGVHWLTPMYDGLLRVGGREQTFKHRMIDQAAVRAGECVLDLGCGTGTLVITLKRQVPDATLVGLDCDPTVLRRAGAKALRARVTVHFDRGFSWELPYRSGTFDAVLSTLFFHHLDTPGRYRTLAEVARVLRRAGRFHVADWGRQDTILMRILSLPDRLLDGPERTADSFAGRLPDMMKEVGFDSVTETGTLDTGFGRLTFYAARKQA